MLTTAKEGSLKTAPSTHFLNVDLDIFSARDLRPLLDSFGKKVAILYSGRHGRTYRAHLELPKFTKTADGAICDFCKIIEALPKAARDAWNKAKQRDFNIGVQGGVSPSSCEFVLSTNTLKVAHNLGARILFTVYAPGANVRHC